jgi:hypothetical protein
VTGPPSPGGPSAARAYKEIMARLAESADELRERDRERATALARRLVDLDAAMSGAEERAALTRLGVELAWEAALEALWAESWMTLRPRPDPDPRADPRHLDLLDEAVERRSATLREAVRRRRFGIRR